MSDKSQEPDDYEPSGSGDDRPSNEQEKKRRQWHDRVRTACAVIGALASVLRDIPPRL